MHRNGITSVCRLLAAVCVAGFLSAPAAAQKAGEFPNDWYFYGDARPDQYRSLEGRPARPLKLTNWIGEPQDLDSLKGKVVVIDFWATWCGPCMKALPKNVKLMNRYRDDGLVIIGVHDSKRWMERMPGVAKQQKLNYPLAVDDRGASASAWRIRFWPSYFVVDRNGVVRAAGLSPERIENVVKILLDEPADDTKPPATNPPAMNPPAASPPAAKPPAATPPPADTPDDDPTGTSGPVEIPASWLEGTRAQRRVYAGLLADGTPPPIRSREWLNTEPLDISALRGRVVMLDFWGVWCGPCIASIPKTNELHRKYKDQGLVVLAVCDHRRIEQMAAVVAEKGIEYPVCGDHGADLTRAYKVDTFPDYHFIDRSGRLRAVDVLNGRIEDVIKLLLAESAPVAIADR